MDWFPSGSSQLGGDRSIDFWASRRFFVSCGDVWWDLDCGLFVGCLWVVGHGRFWGDEMGRGDPWRWYLLCFLSDARSWS